jgi:multiple sugar transport system ATP-binding protein
MPDIWIKQLTKRFGAVTAVDGLTLEIGHGEFVTLLGPSGCGKTTTLRCLAGLEEPDAGEIFFGKRCVFSAQRGVFVPPGGRGIGLVFQNYALWPHMTVFHNVAFGLRKKKLPRAEIRRRVMEILNLLGLQGYENRFPSELSGGQQQRVALARMIVTEPEILLFDEPLSNLDAKLRMTLRAELKRLHAEIGATTVYVTHDQVEALTLSTRIAVMNLGIVQQVGSPAEVYHHPANLFVAEFMGNPSTNLLRTRVLDPGPPTRVALEADPTVTLVLEGGKIEGDAEEVIVNVRPEDVEISASPMEGGIAAGLSAVLPTGSECVTYLRLREGEYEIVSKGPEEMHLYLEPNQRVWIRFKRGNVFDEESGTLLFSFGFKVPGGKG